MKHYTPDYYNLFRCAADECEDSCCRAGWLIPIDGETFEFYRAAREDIEKNTLDDGGDRVFKLRDDKSCVYLSDGGLCELMLRTGRQCGICNDYPRFFEEYDGFCEAGISVSCPIAAKIVLSCPKNPYADVKRRSPDRLLQFLADGRQRALEMIFSEPDPDIAVIKLVGYSAELQQMIDFDMLEQLDAAEFVKEPQLMPQIAQARKFIAEKTEILGAGWRGALLSGEVFSSGTAQERRSYLGYLTYRYFLKAINSEDILTECRLIALLYGLAAEVFCDYGSAVKTVSRELEHDVENLDALREYLSV